MKSDTDFANPYEKELDAQESKIKELEKKLKEALNGVLLKRYNQEKEGALAKLKITTKALNKIYDDDRSMEDMERTANRALSEVEDYEETEMVKE
jgi:DNA repair ATPase RecN